MAFTSHMSTPPSDGPADEHMRKTIRRKVAWRVIPVLAFAYLMANLERTNLGIASLSMNSSLSLTTATYGLAAGLYFVGYFICEVPSNLAMARFGARKWLARIAITWGIVATATAAVQGPTSLYVMRILLGVAEAGLFPGVIFYFTLWFVPRDRAKMLALFGMGATVSGLAGPPLAGAILALWPHGLFGLEGWRALFVLEGIPSIVVGLLIWMVLVDSPDKARWLTHTEKAWLTEHIYPSSESSGGRNPLRALADLRILLLSLSYFAKNAGGYVLVFFMPQIIQTLTVQRGAHYSTLTISLLSAIPAVFAGVTAITWAASSDRHQERRWHSAIPLCVAAIGIVWATATTNPIVLLVALTFASAGIGSMSGAFFQIPPTFLAGPAVAVGIATINATGNLGGFVGPYLFGILKDTTGSFFAGNLILAVLLLIGAAIIFLPMFRPKHGNADLTTSSQTDPSAAQAT
ncbi:MFS transporter [Streptomyces sp. NBC_01361]|uniref:MFS transporter n=1 Tax=Streptomyces sp. NBC_01361 TaxID=2903838 RepID=UPI002E34F6BB|nr:MFS transporter [Streptomyces sp. NBC_01361]